MPTSQSESWHAILVAVTASGLDIGALKAHAISQELVTALDISAVVASVEPASPLGAELAAAKAVRSTCLQLLHAGATCDARSGQKPNLDFCCIAGWRNGCSHRAEGEGGASSAAWLQECSPCC